MGRWAGVIRWGDSLQSLYSWGSSWGHYDFNKISTRSSTLNKLRKGLFCEPNRESPPTNLISEAETAPHDLDGCCVSCTSTVSIKLSMSLFALLLLYCLWKKISRILGIWFVVWLSWVWVLSIRWIEVWKDGLGYERSAGIGCALNPSYPWWVFS